jgi:hypothetical protein
MRRRWIRLIAVGTPALAAVGIAGLLSLLAGGGGGLAGRLLAVAFIVVTLGGLVVLPGTTLIVRYLRGIPDVRVDELGLTWGRDRSRDLALDWVDVERVEIRIHNSGLGDDRVFVLTPLAGSGSPAGGRLGRFTAAVNRLTFGSPFAVSTQFEDCPWTELRDLIAARLPGTPIVETDPRQRSRGS